MSSRESFKRDNHSGHRGKHPKHLRGKAIGLWYAGRQKELKREERTVEKKPLGHIYLSPERNQEIERVLSKNIKLNDSDLQKHKVFHKQFLEISQANLEEKLKKYTHRQIKQNEFVDSQLKSELQENIKTNSQYHRLLPDREKLPCFKKYDDIITKIWENQITLVSGETGCGKTTQIAQYILDKCIIDGNGSVTKIICTQPRRISAISVSERVAAERGEKIGQTVGYQIRLEKCLPRDKASILYCTTGVLLKQMETDPFLNDVSHVILDEIHERDVLCDFLITLLKQLVSKRPDLKLILMSATFNSEQFAKYFNHQCGKISIPGFTYPVTEYYIEDVLKDIRHEFLPYNKKYKKNPMQDYLNFAEPYFRQLERSKEYPNHVIKSLRNPNSEEIDFELIKKLIHEISYKGPGAILVFLPGYSDINKLNRTLTESSHFPKSKYLIIPLHSRMPSAQQKIIFKVPPDGIRKIIIATNIAETSITINDVVYVINSGKIKIKNYNVEKNIDRLTAEWVSQANADQRKGRAGRVKPGVCFHLYTKARKMLLDKQQLPEILRERLENVILQIKILGLGNAESFLTKLMDTPALDSIHTAISTLRKMNALDSEEKLTPLGYHLAKLPMGPQTAKMVLLGALFSCLDPILSIAASLDFKDAFSVPLNKDREALEQRRQLSIHQNSDHILLHEALIQYISAKKYGQGRDFCWKYFLSVNTLDLLHDMKGQLAEYLREMGFIDNNDFSDPKWNLNSDNVSLVKAIIAAGLYPNVAIVKKVRLYNKVIITVHNERVHLVKSSTNESAQSFDSPLLIYFLKLQSDNRIYLHDTTMIYPLPLFFFGDEILIGEDEDSATIELPTEVPLKYKCTMRVAKLIKKLRKKFDDILEYKISNPGRIDWNEGDDYVEVLKAIMQLITSEEMGEAGVIDIDSI